MDGDRILYRSRQYAGEQAIVSVTMGGCVAAMVAVAALTESDGGEWVAVVLGSVLMLGICLAPLTVAVTREGVAVRFAGLFRADIPMTDIADVIARSYQPLKQFGGWGWRFGRNGSRQYAMSGTRAAVITRTDGREVYLGGRDVQALADAIGAARAGAPVAG